MCVIFIAGDKRPTDDMVDKAFDQNDAGFGVAWREDGLVKWEKGIGEVKEAQHLCRELPLPYVAHFRIPTEGGRRPQLCHPFPIEPDVPLDLKGETKGYVLFHNGHWSDWRKETFAAVKEFKLLVPPGKWSDTRGMALVSSLYGVQALELINEKAVAFSPTDMEIVAGASGWHAEEGIWCSNLFWKTGRRTYTGFHGHEYPRRMCREQGCVSYDIDNTGFCPKHRRVIEIPATTEKEEHTASKTSTGQGTTTDGASGGSSIHGPFDVKRLPFHLVEQLFRAKKISKKMYKRARKEWEKEQKTLARSVMH